MHPGHTGEAGGYTRQLRYPFTQVLEQPILYMRLHPYIIYTIYNFLGTVLSAISKYDINEQNIEFTSEEKLLKKVGFEIETTD